jgi:RNA polymerase sigma-70 factor (ECF subfamily)
MGGVYEQAFEVADAGADPWLPAFHAGLRGTLEAVYREHFADVLRVARRYVDGADAETITHEVFYRLLTDDGLRRNFEGGRFTAWLRQVVANAALDHLRRGRFEDGQSRPPRAAAHAAPQAAQASCADEVEAKVLIERFRRERLPPQWAGVFDARFLRQLAQREAADELGMRRSTLAYQEERIRALLREFLLAEDKP